MGGWLGRCAAAIRRLRAACPAPAQPPGSGPHPEHSLGLHRIVSAVAPRIAPEQTPPREHQAPKYAVLPDRLHRVARARRLVLAAPAESPARSGAGRRRSGRSRRARAIRAARPGADAGDSCARGELIGSSPAAGALRGPARQPRLGDQLRQRRLHPGQPLALGELARPRDGRRRPRPGPAVSSRLGVRERLAQQPLDPVALDRAADLARHRQPQPRPLASRRSGTCTAPGGGWRSSVPAGRRARTRRCATGAGPSRRLARVRRAGSRQALRRRGACVPCRDGASASAARRASCMRARNPCARARLRFFGW